MDDNGEPFVYILEFARTRHADGVYFAGEYAERNVLFDEIISVGMRPLEVWKIDPSDYPGSRTPDFRVVLAEGDVFVGCTRGGDRSVSFQPGSGAALLGFRAPTWLAP